MPPSRPSRRAFLIASLRAGAAALGAVALRHAPAAHGQPLSARIANGDAWLDLDPLDGGFALRAGRGAAALMRTDAPLVVMVGADAIPLGVQSGAPLGDALAFSGQAGDWSVSGRAAFEPDLPALIRLDLTLAYGGSAPTQLAALSRWTLPDAGVPAWLVPGAFYGSGPAPGYQGRPYPRFDPAGGDPDRLVSNAWLMRMDRASHPAVFAQTQHA